MEDHTTRDWTLTRSSRAHAGGRAEHAAIVCEGRTTTYAKLHRESNRAAHALRDAGTVPYTHLTPPTNREVTAPGVPGSFTK
ncbi:hypothetical protein RMO59_38670, partial [Streptomyces alfalfae]